MDKRCNQTPPTLAHELNERLQEEAFPHFGNEGFSSPRNLYSSGGFSAKTELDPVDDTEDTTLPLKNQHEHPSSRGKYLFIYLLMFFYL
jgi:hypothetical protein